MPWISAVLEGPAQTKLLLELAELVGGGVMELKRDWDDGVPVHSFDFISVHYCARTELSVLESLLHWADAKGIGIKVHTSDRPLGLDATPFPPPVDREYAINRVRSAIQTRRARRPD